MYVVCVHVFVKPGHEQDFIEATQKNHEGTLGEEGALRFDVLQGSEDKARFFLYEVYRSPEDFAAHQKTEHYLTWRNKVGAWMAQPRQSSRFDSVFPADDAF